MQDSIETKYLKATDTKGARMKATSQWGTLTVGYDYGLDASQNHAEVARRLAESKHWSGAWFGGRLATGRYAFVRVLSHKPALMDHSTFYIP